MDGQLLSYQEAGPADGPVVLLLHGLLSESTTWAPAIAPLAGRGLHVIALDLVGHGESDKPPLAYYLDDFAASVSAFLTHLDLGAGDAGRAFARRRDRDGVRALLPRSDRAAGAGRRPAGSATRCT